MAIRQRLYGSLFGRRVDASPRRLRALQFPFRESRGPGITHVVLCAATSRGAMQALRSFSIPRHRQTTTGRAPLVSTFSSTRRGL